MLEDAWENAPFQANTLRERLVFERTQVTSILKAGPISSVGKNSTSQSYRSYEAASLTHVQLAEVWTRLISYYDTVKSNILAAFVTAGISVPDTFDFDSPVHDLLVSFLRVQGQADVLPDISQLRWPVQIVPQPEFPSA